MGTTTLPRTAGICIDGIAARGAQSGGDGTNAKAEFVGFTGGIVNAIPFFTEPFSSRMSRVQCVRSPTQLVVCGTTGRVDRVTGLTAQTIWAVGLICWTVLIITNQTGGALACATAAFAIAAYRIGDAPGALCIREAGITCSAIVRSIAGQVLDRIKVVEAGAAHGEAKEDREGERSHGWAPTKAARP